MNESAGRRARAAAFLLLTSFVAGAAGAQRLWTVGEVSRAPEGPAVVMAGSTANAGFAGMPVPAEAAEVQVTFDYLRLGMGYLELPLPDGSLIEAENAVFEDRGGGNLMWTGEVPGAGYESVLFTVQDGHLVGWFGAPGGPQYVVRAGPDGRGTMAVEVGPTGDWCGYGTTIRQQEGARTGPFLAQKRTAAGKARTGAASTDTLDILVVFDEGAEAYWKRDGGILLAIQSVGDYFNMVLRNSGLSTSARAIPVAWTPETGSAPLEIHRYPGRQFTVGGSDLLYSKRLDALRLRHGADLTVVVEFPRADLFARGKAQLGNVLMYPGGGRYGLFSDVSAPWLSSGDVFTHELGHNLGSSHEAPYDRCCGTSGGGSSWCDYVREVMPVYACGHTDLTATPRPVHTIMSYGRVPSGSPHSMRVPYFSSPALYKPNDWTLGLIGEADNVLVFREMTLPRAIRLSDIAVSRPPGVTGLTGRWTGRGSVELRWEDRRTWDHLMIRLGDDYWEAPGYGRSWNERADRVSSTDQFGVDLSGLRPGGRYAFSVVEDERMSEIFVLEPVEGTELAAPRNVAARETGSDSIRLTWADNSDSEDGFEVWYRKWTPGDSDWSAVDLRWQRYGSPLPPGRRHMDVEGLVAEETIGVTESYYDSRKRVWVRRQTAKRGRYSFAVLAYNGKGFSASETYDLEFMPGPYPAPTKSGEITDCDVVRRPVGVDLGGYQVHACLETPDGARRRAWDYRLEADQSGLLYFFDRDNAEILVKVLDGCAINGHRWVFVAPVTTLAFRLQIRELSPYSTTRRQVWYYDSERRPQDRIERNLGGRVGNPNGRTARTVSDTTAFPCTTAEIAAAKAVSADGGSGPGFASLGAAPLPGGAGPVRSLSAGARTDCEPGGRTLTLSGGYTVGMCYETADGRVGEARDWGLDSSESGLLYFFDRNNAEVLLKVLDGCGVNGHRWVFVAPVTDLAFNLVVESPDGQRWTHANRLGRTADAASDVSAFPCSA